MTDVQALSAIITEEPEVASVPYYFATKKGWYSNVPTLFGTAHIPADKWPKQLPELETLFHFSEEKVPIFIFQQALDFFRKVYAAYQTEATTYICRDEDGQYSLFIPKQYVTGASVNHRVDTGEMGKRMPVGTIHSHCNFSAFHSGTDEHDMGKMPGLHVTIGLVDSEAPEYAVAIAVGDTKFDIKQEQIVTDEITLDANGFATAPDRWLKYVMPNQTAPWTGGISTKYGHQTAKGPGYKMGQMRPVGFQAPAWWADEGYDYYSSFQPTGISRDELNDDAQARMTTRWLEDETREMAELGYVLEWTLEKDAEGAQSLLEADQARTGQDTLPFGGSHDVG